MKTTFPHHTNEHYFLCTIVISQTFSILTFQ